MAKKSGLGKGLDALFLDNETAESSSLMTLRVSDIEPNKDQPRKAFEPNALAELADSIREHGILQPVVVRALPGGVYQIIAGERRWRASRMAGLSEIPAIVIEADDAKVRELALIENLQRQDLTTLEEAEGYRSLMEHSGMTQEEVAARLGKSRPVVANALRLLNLPKGVKMQLDEGFLTAGHARLLASLPEADAIRWGNDVVLRGLNVRELETALKKERNAAKKAAERKANAKEDPWGDKELREMQLSLQEELGRRVTINRKGMGGILTIAYSDEDDLIDLVDKLLDGLDYAKLAIIISNQSDQIADAIAAQMDRGVTALKGTGWYTKEDKNVLMCAVKRYDIHRVKVLVHEMDPDAFMIFTSASEVLGEGFKDYK